MDEKELLKNLNARCFELHEKQHAFVSPNANSDFFLYSKNKHKKFTLEAIRLSCLRAARAITAQDARRVERPLF